MNEENAISVIEPVRPVVTAEQGRQGWQDFEALKAAILVDDDYQRISDKKFIKRSGFRKIGVCFNLSDSILEEERTDRDDGSFMWRIVVEVTAPNGRTVVGVGICDSAERNFAHVEHDVYATSHTRAKNRAISDMVAGGAVSAEEMTPAHSKVQRRDSGYPPQEFSIIDRKAVLNVLEEAGLDSTCLSIYPDSGKIVILPLEHLGDSWGRYNDALKPLGTIWRRDGREARWEVPVP